MSTSNKKFRGKFFCFLQTQWYNAVYIPEGDEALNVASRVMLDNAVKWPPWQIGFDRGRAPQECKAMPRRLLQPRTANRKKRRGEDHRVAGNAPHPTLPFRSWAIPCGAPSPGFPLTPSQYAYSQEAAPTHCFLRFPPKISTVFRKCSNPFNFLYLSGWHLTP